MLKQKKMLLIVAVAAISFFSCSQLPEDNTSVKGTISGFANKSIFVSSSNIVDTIKTDEVGGFEFSANIAEPGFFRFMAEGNRSAVILLIAPGEHLTVSVPDTADWQRSYVVEGSSGSALLYAINKHYMQSLRALEQIRTDYNAQVESVPPASEEYKSITEKAAHVYDSVVSGERDFLVQFITKNPGSLASISALYQTFDYRTGKPILLDKEDGLTYFEMVDTVLMSKYPQLNDVQSFHKNYLQIKSSMERQNALQSAQNAGSFDIGDEAPNITMPTPSGNTLSLADLRGNVVLLDFWASWCAPCRAENPAIVRAYNQFKNKGFDVFQVSLDKSKQAWIDAIKKDGLVWRNHVSDLQFWNSAAAKLYGVESIPANYLLNKDGKVIAKNMRGEELISALQELLQ